MLSDSSVLGDSPLDTKGQLSIYSCGEDRSGKGAERWPGGEQGVSEEGEGEPGTNCSSSTWAAHRACLVGRLSFSRKAVRSH